MDLRERIIDEATKMFVQYGVKAIRMDDIAVNLSISKRTIYETFGDKETLITECIMNYYDCENEKKKALLVGTKNVIEEFLAMLKHWNEGVENNFRMMSSVRKFYPKIYARVTSEHAKTGFPLLKQKLEEGVRDGLLVEDINYNLAITVFSYSLFGVSEDRKMVLPDNVSQLEALKYIVVYFFRGIATIKGIKLIDEFIEKETANRKVM